MAYEFAVSLDDEVSPGAKASGDAVAQLSARMRLAQLDIAGTSKALKASQTGMQTFASGVVRVAETVKSAVSQIGGVGSALAHGDLAGAVDKITSAVAVAAKSLDGVLPGLGTALGSVIPLVGGFVSSVVGATTSLMGLAIHSAEGRKRTLAFYDAMSDGHATGVEYAKMISDLANKIGFTTSSLKPFAGELMAMGHRDLPDLKRELVAVASAQTLMLAVNENGGASYVSLARKIEAAAEGTGKLKLSAKSLGRDLAGIGLSVKDVATAMGMTGEELAKALKAGSVEASKFGDAVRDAVTAKGKGPLAEFSHSLDGISNRFHNMIGKLFAGADVSPFLKALEDVVTGFGQIMGVAKGSGSAMNGLFVFAGKAVKWLSLAFLDAIIWIGGAIDTVSEFFSETGDGAGIVDMLSDSFKTLGAMLGLVVGPLKMIIDLVGQLKGAFTAKGWAQTLSSGISGMSDEAKAALQAQGAAKPVAAGAVAQIDPAAATASGIATGKALSDGVAVGIASGAVGVVEAATKMATAGAQAVKTQLKVQSPSRVMIDVGENVSEGFAIGMRGGIPDVQGAANDLSNIRIAPPANSNGGRESGGAQSERSSGPITVYVQIDGAGMSAQDITDEMVATTFERLRLAAGGG